MNEIEVCMTVTMVCDTYCTCFCASRVVVYCEICYVVLSIYSAIHKAAGFTVPSRSMISTGTIPVEHKSVHWLSMSRR